MKDDTIIRRLDSIEAQLREIKQLLSANQPKAPGSDHSADQGQIISAKEVARLLQCTPQAVYTKCAKDELPHVKMGKSIKFKRSEILDWIKNDDMYPMKMTVTRMTTKPSP